MLEELRDVFRRRFGRDPEWAARAPGRVNLIGEHTDTSGGLVLPCAIDRDVMAVAAPRADGRLRIHSREWDEEAVFAVVRLERRGHWSDYARGALFALGESGRACAGADVAVASAVPPESGLSSSAAFLVALLAVLDEAPPRERALLAHRAESGFVGVPCGVMDPFASSLGRADAALRIDCASLAVEEVPLAGAALLVAHSGVTRALADGSYETRQREVTAAFEAARAAGVGGPSLRALGELRPEQLGALEAALPPALFRRARHVVTENARVDATCAALRAGDLAVAGACLRQGQASLRDDFAVSVPELDVLCELGDAQPGVFGSRLTGAGFGGCTLHLVEAAAAGEAARALAEGFERRFGRRPPIHRVRPSDGAARLPL